MSSDEQIGVILAHINITYFEKMPDDAVRLVFVDWRCSVCLTFESHREELRSLQEECPMVQMRRDRTRGIKVDKAAGKRGERAVCASSVQNTRCFSALVVIQIKVGGRNVRAIVGTGF